MVAPRIGKRQRWALREMVEQASNGVVSEVADFHPGIRRALVALHDRGIVRLTPSQVRYPNGTPAVAVMLTETAWQLAGKPVNKHLFVYSGPQTCMQCLLCGRAEGAPIHA
jgi:hypothetical protein